MQTPNPWPKFLSYCCMTYSFTSFDPSIPMKGSNTYSFRINSAILRFIVSSNGAPLKSHQHGALLFGQIRLRQLPEMEVVVGQQLAIPDGRFSAPGFEDAEEEIDAGEKKWS